MKPSEFVKTYFPYAKKLQYDLGVSAIATLAQAALESGWGEHAIGFNFFGIKDADGVNGNEQLIITTEYLKSYTAKFPIVISKVWNPTKKFYKYVVKDYFRKYDTPYQSFADHAHFFFVNKRYFQALEYKTDPYRFIDEIAKAGYATDPSYSKLLKQVAKMIENEIIKQKL